MNPSFQEMSLSSQEIYIFKRQELLNETAVNLYNHNSAITYYLFYYLLNLERLNPLLCYCYYIELN
jgi:hypothetical protein